MPISCLVPPTISTHQQDALIHDVLEVVVQDFPRFAQADATGPRTDSRARPNGFAPLVFELSRGRVEAC